MSSKSASLKWLSCYSDHFQVKSKEGVVERVGSSGYEVICKGMFKKETDLANLFAGLRVSLSTGEAGKIEDSFGQG